MKFTALKGITDWSYPSGFPSKDFESLGPERTSFEEALQDLLKGMEIEKTIKRVQSTLDGFFIKVK